MAQVNPTSGSRLLEAEGELNQEIHNALNRFRDKIVAEVESAGRKESTSKAMDQKEGPEKKFVFRESLMSMMF